jgi:high-affinity K+ transport system ATPase subunit B
MTVLNNSPRTYKSLLRIIQDLVHIMNNAFSVRQSRNCIVHANVTTTVLVRPLISLSILPYIHHSIVDKFFSYTVNICRVPPSTRATEQRTSNHIALKSLLPRLDEVLMQVVINLNCTAQYKICGKGKKTDTRITLPNTIHIST